MFERFFKKVEKTDTCWIWTGSKGKPSGYGRVNLKGKNVLAHRVSYELQHGPIPKGKGYHGNCVLHKCDNRSCVRPSHLFLGTQKENMRDCIRKGRFANLLKTHCAKGHEFTRENTGRDLKRNKRYCKACKRIRRRVN